LPANKIQPRFLPDKDKSFFTLNVFTLKSSQPAFAETKRLLLILIKRQVCHHYSKRKEAKFSLQKTFDATNIIVAAENR